MKHHPFAAPAPRGATDQSAITVTQVVTAWDLVLRELLCLVCAASKWTYGSVGDAQHDALGLAQKKERNQILLFRDYESYESSSITTHCCREPANMKTESVALLEGCLSLLRCGCNTPLQMLRVSLYCVCGLIFN